MPIDDFAPLAKSTEDFLQRVSRDLLNRINPPAGPYAIFHHQAYAIERVRDVLTILKRLFANSDRLIAISWQLERMRRLQPETGHQTSPEMQQLYLEDGELTQRMKLDLESLYIFGAILLDQWSFLVAYMLGIPKPEEITFRTLVGNFEADEERGVQNELWVKQRREMLWLTHQFRYYRNKFIVHADRPWQRGVTRTTFGEGFNLFTPSPPGWLDDAEIGRQIDGLLPLASKGLQEQPDDYWEKRGRALLERLFMSIGDVENRQDREKIAHLVQQAGIPTPDFTVLARNLLKFVAEATSIVIEMALNNIGRVNLGAPKTRPSENQRRPRKPEAAQIAPPR